VINDFKTTEQHQLTWLIPDKEDAYVLTSEYGYVVPAVDVVVLDVK